MRLNVYSSAVFTGIDLFALKFYLDRVVSYQHYWRRKKLETLGYLTVKTASLCVPSY